MSQQSAFKLIVLGLVLLATWFYWFEIRPTTVKAECEKQSEQVYKSLATKEDTDGDGMIPRSSINAYIDRSHAAYTDCLHKNGL